MIKKIGALALTLVGLYLILKDQSPTRLLERLPASISTQKQSNEALLEDAKKNPSSPPAGNSSKENNTSESPVVTAEATKILLDPKRPAEARLKAWETLSRSLPGSSAALVQVALSENPFEEERHHAHEENEAHGIKEFQFDREESFRIMAVQSLERALLDKKLTAGDLQNIAQNAASPTVRAIAQKILEFAKDGMSYSEMAEAAIARMKRPDQKKEE